MQPHFRGPRQPSSNYDVALATSMTEGLTALHEALIAEATFVSAKIREKVQSLLDISKEIQGANANLRHLP
jgi:hypothetical protein